MTIYSRQSDNDGDACDWWRAYSELYACSMAGAKEISEAICGLLLVSLSLLAAMIFLVLDLRRDTANFSLA